MQSPSAGDTKPDSGLEKEEAIPQSAKQSLADPPAEPLSGTQRESLSHHEGEHDVEDTAGEDEAVVGHTGEEEETEEVQDVVDLPDEGEEGHDESAGELEEEDIIKEDLLQEEDVAEEDVAEADVAEEEIPDEQNEELVEEEVEEYEYTKEEVNIFVPITFSSTVNF